MQFGADFLPPGDLDYTSGLLELSIRPGPYEIPQERFEFVWELESFNQDSGEMIIQVNFTSAKWISANKIPDNLEVKLIDYEQFMPTGYEWRRLQTEEDEMLNHTLSIVASR